MVNTGHKGNDPDRYAEDSLGTKSLQGMRKKHIERILELTQGDVEAAAIILKLSVADLRRWMTRLGIKHDGA